MNEEQKDAIVRVITTGLELGGGGGGTLPRPSSKFTSSMMFKQSISAEAQRILEKIASLGKLSITAARLEQLLKGIPSSKDDDSWVLCYSSPFYFYFYDKTKSKFQESVPSEYRSIMNEKLPAVFTKLNDL
jgi:hypothetical protein